MTGVRLQMDDVRFGYDDWSVEFDVTVDAGWFVAVIGPSGAGKSTLLNLVAGFEIPQAGSVAIDGASVNELPPADRPITMLFQENNLFAHLDAWSNIALGISPALKLDAEDRAQITTAMERVGLAGKDKRLPAELSGGERQRVAIARALVRDRPLLLLDEPFAALGPALKAEMLDLVSAIHRDRGMTVLMVTHHPEDAKLAASHTAYLEDGKIVALDETRKLFSRTDLPGLTAYLGQ